MTPLNFVKLVLQNSFLLNTPEVVFLPIVTNKYQIQLSLYWVCVELPLAYKQFKRNCAADAAFWSWTAKSSHPMMAALT